MTRLRFFLASIAAITTIHFVIWLWSWPAATNDDYFTLLPSQTSKEFPADADDRKLAGTNERGFVGVVLSIPLFVPFGCLFWNNFRPIAILLGFLNSALWGVGLTCALFALENALWKRWRWNLKRAPRNHPV
jgi:hypothetical protein